MRSIDVAGAVLTAVVLVFLAACAERVAPVPEEPASDEATRERHVALEGQANFRDIGGYETADGRSVKWGQVYRSGKMPGLTDSDVERLDDLALHTVVTFLVPGEIERYGADRLPEGAREVRLPITGERAEELSLETGRAIRSGDFSALPADLNPEFHRLLLEDGREEYAALLRELIDPSNRPLVYHCSHGVHRTGTATAILLSALGVPWETIREDYLLSNEYLGEEIETELERIRQEVASDRGISPEEVDMTNVDAFYTLEGHYIDAALEKAVEDYGSMEGYIRDGLGLTSDEIDRLREELLD